MVFQDLLDLLRDNKQFPNYAAERRIDIFINLFLEEFLSVYYKQKVVFVVPEFPLKKDEKNNQTDKLDYLCAFEETKQPIFVELKTDVISFSGKQAKFYYQKAKHWPGCIGALRAIIATRMPFSYRIKYFQLVKRLFEAGLVVGENTESSLLELEALSKGIDATTFEREERIKKMKFSCDLIDLTKSLKARWDDEAKLLYLAPHNDDLKEKIKCICQGHASLLDFTQIESMPISSNMKYGMEFNQLVEFLKTIK